MNIWQSRRRNTGSTKEHLCSPLVFGRVRVAHLISFLCCVFGRVCVAHLISFLCCVFGRVRVAHLISFLPNIFTMSVGPDEGYSRNVLWSLYYMCTLFVFDINRQL